MARTSKKMYPLVKRWEQSGKSKRDFCKEVRLNIHVFNYWLRKYRQEVAKNQDSSATNNQQKTDFVELQVEQPPAASDYLVTDKAATLFAEIDYPNGVGLRLHHPINVRDLQNLLQSFR